MKKILYIHHGSNQGGAPRSLGFLIQQLDRKKYIPYVLCISDERNISFFESFGAKVVFDNHIRPFHGSTVSGMSIKLFGKNLLGVFPSRNHVRKIIREIKPDIVHLNSTCLFVAAGAIKKEMPEIPIVCHIREPLLNGFAGNILRKGNKKYVDYYIAIEQYDADSVLPQNAPIKVVYNFVDFSDYNPGNTSNVLREELGLNKEDFCVLYLARFAPSNGTLELAEEFARHNDGMKLILVGDKPSSHSDYSNKIRKIAKNCKDISILPFRTDVPDLIAGCNITISPFTEPHFARTVIEAGAMKKASVVSDIGGLSELVQDGKTGLVFSHQNFSECYEKCLYLKDHPQILSNMNEQAYIYAHEHFESVKNASKIFDIYEELLKGRQ